MSLKAKIKYRFIMMLCAFIFSMCQLNNKSRKENTISNKDLIEINADKLNMEETILFSSVFSGFKIIALETNNDCLIGQIDDLQIMNDTLYILDRSIAKALFVFDEKGKFIRKIGNIGKGPGEYIRPHSFSLDVKNNQIQIFDIAGKILKFTTKGKLIKEIFPRIKNPAVNIACLDGIIYIDHQIRNYKEKSDYLISAIDESGNVVKEWLPERLYSTGLKQPINSTNQLILTNNDLKYMKPFMDTIFSIRKDKTIRPFLHITTRNKMNLSEMIELNKATDFKEIHFLFSRSKKFLGIKDYIENSNLIMFCFQNYGNTHTLFFSKINNRLLCTKNPVIDDLTLTTGYRRFYSTYKNCFISALDHKFNKLELLTDNIKNQNIKLSKEEQYNLKKLSSNSNPVVILYECREKIETKVDSVNPN